jgi:hypothetical protein
LRSPKQLTRLSCVRKQLYLKFFKQQTFIAQLSQHDGAFSPHIQATQVPFHVQGQRLAAASHVTSLIVQLILSTTFLVDCGELNQGCVHELGFNAPIQFSFLFLLQRSTES